MKHHHHHSLINGYAFHHDHEPDDHDADGKHNDGTWGDFDTLYGPAHYSDEECDDD